jgi:hypothetical protein
MNNNNTPTYGSTSMMLLGYYGYGEYSLSLDLMGS